MPSTIETLQRERKSQKFSVILVNFKEGPEKVAAWVRARDVTATVALDRDGAVTALYRVAGTPTAVLIGRGGKMIARAVGPQAWNRGSARQLLDALVNTP